MGIILLLVVMLVVVGIVGAVVSHLMGSAQGEKARQRYSAMHLAELRAALPPTKLVVGVTQGTIYGNDRVAWFAALLERTFAEPATTEDDLAYLNQKYTELLRQLAEFLTSTFPTSWNPAEPDKPVVLVLGQADAYYSAVTDRSLGWLSEMAARQKALLARTPRTMPQWDPALFTTKRGVNLPSAPFGTQQSVLETPCTLARLQQEIQRLGERGSG